MTTAPALRIALVSYEFPPAVAIGGIGTYAWEAARMLAAGGHQVAVFAAGDPRTIGPEPALRHGVVVHRIAARDRQQFRQLLPTVFAKEHQCCPFDVVESPEVGAEAEAVCRQFPDLPLVVKLHTSSDLLQRLGADQAFWAQRLRVFLGGLRRGRLVWLPRAGSNPEHRLERLFTTHADAVAAPSAAIASVVQRDWSLDPQCADVFPLPFRPNPGLLALPLPDRLDTIGFLGRLETRKGIFDLARAVLPLLSRHPSLHLRLIGPSWPTERGDSFSWLRDCFQSVLAQVSFCGAIPPDRLGEELGACSVVVLPSRWESFGLVCAESMAAGRLVIGSSAGGMAEMIHHGVHGYLVPPRSPRAIRRLLKRLIHDPSPIRPLAAAGRERIRELLDPERVLPLQLANYHRAIAQARSR